MEEGNQLGDLATSSRLWRLALASHHSQAPLLQTRSQTTPIGGAAAADNFVGRIIVTD